MSEADQAGPERAPHDAAERSVIEDSTRPHRLAMFSDGVFAVIITILVLELKPPEGATFAALLPLWPTAASYAVSYLFIAIVWLNHHHLLGQVQSVTPRLMWANFAHLFSVSLVPFTTAWIADSHLAHAPVSLYAVIFAATNASYLVLCWEAMDRPQVGDAAMRKFMRMRSWITLGTFGAGAVIAMANAAVGMGLVVLCLIFYMQPKPRSR